MRIDFTISPPSSSKHNWLADDEAWIFIDAFCRETMLVGLNELFDQIAAYGIFSKANTNP